MPWPLNCNVGGGAKWPSYHFRLDTTHCIYVQKHRKCKLHACLIGRVPQTRATHLLPLWNAKLQIWSLVCTLRNSNIAITSLVCTLRNSNIAITSLVCTLRNSNIAITSLVCTLRNSNIAITSLVCTLRNSNCAIRMIIQIAHFALVWKQSLIEDCTKLPSKLRLWSYEHL